MNAYGLGAFGLAHLAPSTPERPVADRPGEARLALTALGAALAAIQATSGVTLLDVLPGQAAVLLAASLLQAVWLIGMRRRWSGTLAGGVALNMLLIAVWAVARTRHPVGVLDALCAADSLAIVLVALTLARPRSGSRAGAVLSQGAILLAVVSLAAAAGGHTHGDRPAGSAGSSVGTGHFYCRLL